MSGFTKVEMSSLLIDCLLTLGGQDNGQRGEDFYEDEGVEAVTDDSQGHGEANHTGEVWGVGRVNRSAGSSDCQTGLGLG
jgi:hypothetical protein